MYNPFSLEGKTVLVTGASSGIGRATAIECSKLGATLVLTGRNESALQETKELLSDSNKEHLMLVADLRIEESCEKLVAQLPVLDGFGNRKNVTIAILLFGCTKRSISDELFCSYAATEIVGEEKETEKFIFSSLYCINFWL